MTDARTLTIPDLAALLGEIRNDGFALLGPTVRDGAIVYGELEGIADLPRGWTEIQEAGSYRLRRRSDEALFGYALGPHSWKQFLFVPRLRLWKAERRDKGFDIDANHPAAPRLALLGVRACELHAIDIQDQIFTRGSHVDADYAARRDNLLLIGLNCGQAGGTCFCVSMGRGPRVGKGADLVISEILSPVHRFVVEAGSARGAEILLRSGAPSASPQDTGDVDALVAATAASMGRSLETADLPALLGRVHDHPHWNDVASRCLACANCTMVCPTCFCSTVEDVSDLRGASAERWRRWDSCFTAEHSYIHGGSVRASTSARYRQWLTHKLGAWVDQFGASGCVGCGRCITWCPTGIDLTREVEALRSGLEGSPEGRPSWNR